MANVDDDLNDINDILDSLRSRPPSPNEISSCPSCSRIKDESLPGSRCLQIGSSRGIYPSTCARCVFTSAVGEACVEQGILKCADFDTDNKPNHFMVWQVENDGSLVLPRWSNLLSSAGGSAYYLPNAISFEILTAPGKPSPFPDIPIWGPRLACPSKDYGVSFDKVQAWLKVCEERHSMCGRVSGAPNLPARVLDVRQLPVKLYEPRPGESKPYLCLPHCWGGSRPKCMTTSWTLETNRQEIVWNNLPATFQHAIDVTRRLGFDYLWIDSLCIIQDSETDWQHQSAEMIFIYENSHLTLCATASEDDNGGFYGDVPTERRPKEITVKGPDGTDYELLVRTDLSNRHLPLPWGVDHHENRRKYFPLLTRAWVFQERLLSRRLLHFTKEELLFECAELITCECHPGVGRYDYRPKHSEPLDKRVLSLSEAALKAPKKKPESLEEAANLEVNETPWGRAVECYTALSLSYPRDKLPALSGVAKQIQRRLRPDDEYLAGLWRSTLLPDLCWWSVGYKQAPQRWRGPSWSWVSIDGPIAMNKFQQRAKNDACSVVDASVLLVGPDAMGEVESGHVILSGTICAGRMKQGSHVDPKILRYPKSASVYDLLLAVNGDERLMFVDCRDYLYDGTVTVGQEIFCLRMGLYNDADEFCLILKRAGKVETSTINEPGCYERIGYMMGYSGDLDRWCEGKARSLIKII